jgi:hypothetical protein
MPWITIAPIPSGMFEKQLDREDDTVVQRIALGRAVEAHSHDGADLLELEQRRLVRTRGGSGVSH